MKILSPRRVHGPTAILAFCLLLVSGAVGSSAHAIKGPLRIAFICSGSVTDGGWNQEGKNAILIVKKKLHAHVSILEHISPVRAVDVMRSYAMRQAVARARQELLTGKVHVTG